MPSAITQVEHVAIPEGWHRTSPGTAEGVPTAEPHTAADAGELVARLVDPALDKNSNRAFRTPSELAWSATPSVPSAHPTP